MIRTIHLHGALGARFGRRIRLDVASPAEAIRALSLMVEGFRDHVEAGFYQVFRGRRGPGLDMSPQELHLRFGAGVADLHLVPRATGAKRQGIGKIIAGTLLIAASFVIPGAWAIAGQSVAGMVATAGIGMALQGVSAMLSPQQRSDYDNRGDQPKSALFGNAVNVATAGSAVPVAVGECEVGSVVVSAAIHVEDRA